jgi:hypothetical protein
MSRSFNFKFSRRDNHRGNVGEEGSKKEKRITQALPHVDRVYDFFWETGNSSSSLGSTASLINEIVLSRLRRLVLGLVIVVPRLAVLLWPRLDGGPIAGNIEEGVGDVGLPPVEAMTCSRAAETFVAGTGEDISSEGDGGFDIIARPS